MFLPSGEINENKPSGDIIDCYHVITPLFDLNL